MTQTKPSSKMGQSSRGAARGGAALALLYLILALVATPHALAQQQNGIVEPESGAQLTGVVSVRGTAAHEQFLRYEVAFNNGGDWLVFAEGQRPVVNGTLAIWDTTIGHPTNPVFPDGVYHLRLRVVRQDYNYDEYFVNNLVVSNALTPTPSATPTAVPGSTPAAGTPAPQVTATSGFMIIRPTALPSLTPFPSPSPALIPEGAGGAPAAPGVGASEGDGGVLQRLRAVDTARFGQAFWTGVRLALVAFALLAAYILLRGLVRILWPRLWAHMNRQE